MTYSICFPFSLHVLPSGSSTCSRFRIMQKRSWGICFEELFPQIAHQAGVVFARRWYWRQSLKTIVHLVVYRVTVPAP